MEVVYALQRQDNISLHTYLHGIFRSPFSAMRWAEESGNDLEAWTRHPRFREWEAQEWGRRGTWVIRRADVWGLDSWGS